MRPEDPAALPAAFPGGRRKQHTPLKEALPGAGSITSHPQAKRQVAFPGILPEKDPFASAIVSDRAFSPSSFVPPGACIWPILHFALTAPIRQRGYPVQ